MKFVDFLIDALTSGVVAALLMGGLAWLCKAQISHWLNRDAEKLRATHQREIEDFKGGLSQEVERLKSDLQRLSTEHSVKFTKLHEQRAEVIAKLYSLLVKTLWAAEGLLNPMELPGEPTKREKAVLAQNSIARTYRYFDRHRIYLPEHVCASLDAMLREIRSPVIQFTTYLRFDPEAMTDRTSVQKLEAWTKGYSTLTTEIPKARRLLETEFRTLLGDRLDAA